MKIKHIILYILIALSLTACSNEEGKIVKLMDCMNNTPEYMINKQQKLKFPNDIKLVKLNKYFCNEFDTTIQVKNIYNIEDNIEDTDIYLIQFTKKCQDLDIQGYMEVEYKGNKIINVVIY